ncbi:hypothetical protein H5410_045975 [Solanum commersonii]|uniref:Uncharacterized protein n=1 Tax=Solanum commersonii TaxID=4109 RepID=A0A9J5XD33_SOLCO|nr:hypothetical protein H5410_045975 [Solanum commersonii]
MLRASVMDGTAFISLLFLNKETIQLLEKTAKELKEGLLEEAEISYPSELGDLMFSNDELIQRNIVILIFRNKSSLEYGQNYDGDKIFETLIKISLLKCGTTDLLN